MSTSLSSHSDNSYLSCFISYSSEDERFVEKLHSDLQKRGVQCWWAPKLRYGAHFPDEIEQAINRQDKFLLILSEHAILSDWVAREIQLANDREKNYNSVILFPVYIDESVLTRIDESIHIDENAFTGNHDWVKELRDGRHIGDFTQWEDQAIYEEKLAILLSQLKVLSGYKSLLSFTQKPFVGRKEDLKWLKGHLREERVTIALGGMGGIGKTTLARMAACQLCEEGRFCDGVAVIDCQGSIDVNGVILRALTRIHPERKQPEGDIEEAVHTLLDNKDTLIILDNVEPDLDISSVVKPLRATSTTLLLTARHVLPTNIVDIRNWRRLDLLSLEEAMKLFIQSYRLGTVEALSATDKDAIERIVIALDRHTLAVELAGRYTLNPISGRDLQTLAKELEEDSQRAIELFPEHDNETPQAVVRIFDRSFDALASEEQKLFTVLAAFATVEFSRRAALALGKAIGLSHPENSLDMLIRRAMVEAYPNYSMPLHTDRERLRLHQLLHGFAIKKFGLLEQSESYKAKRAVSTYYAQYTGEMPQEVLSFDEENIRGALEWSHKQGENVLVSLLCLHMSSFWHNSGRISTSEDYLPWGIEAAGAIYNKTQKREDHLYQADLALANGQALRRIGKLDDAVKALELNLAIRHEEQDFNGEGMVLSTLGRIAHTRGKLKAAERYCKKALVLHRKIGNRKEEGVDLSSLGQIAQTRGDFKAAQSYYERSLPIREEMVDKEERGAKRGKAMDLCFLGMTKLELRQLEDAEDNLNQSLTILLQIHDKAYEGVVYSELGYLAYLRGQIEEAEAHYQKADKIARDVVDPRTQCELFPRMAALTAEKGELENARTLYNKALEVSKKSQYEPYIANIRFELGKFLIEKMGEREEGCAELLEAKKIYTRIGGLQKEKVVEKVKQLGCDV